MHFTLLTVFTAIECGRLLDAAKLRAKGPKGREKVSALNGELLYRTASMRVNRALREWGSPRLGEEVEVDLETLECQDGKYWTVQDAHETEYAYTWDVTNAQHPSVVLGQPVTLGHFYERYAEDVVGEPVG